MDDFIIFALGAAAEAIEFGWTLDSDEDAYRTGVMIGSGSAGSKLLPDPALLMKEKGPRRISPFFYSVSLINLASGQVSIKYGYKGPKSCPCHRVFHRPAIGDASRLIGFGDADVMIAGGAEAAVCRLGIAGFAAARALSS